jgi:hypothetical protein
MTTLNRDLFLITGIPGTGKTRYGDKFATDFGFVHYDREATRRLTASEFVARFMEPRARHHRGRCPIRELSVCPRFFARECLHVSRECSRRVSFSVSILGVRR